MTVEALVWSNGRFHAARSTWAPGDERLSRGEGLFETIRIHLGVPLYLNDHLTRLECSALAIGLPRPPGRAMARLERTIARWARRAGIIEGRCRLTWAPGRLSLTVTPLARVVAASGVAVRSVSWRRAPGSPVHRHKTISRLEHRLALSEAETHGSFEALFLDVKGRILEGSRTNVFVVRRGRVATPSLDLPVLPGTARARFIRLCGDSHAGVRERPLSMSEALRSDEVFLTNALHGVIPVSRIDGLDIGDGRPGPVARWARRLLEEDARREASRVSLRILQRARRIS